MNPAIRSKLWSETLGNESTAAMNSLKNPAKLVKLAAPMRKTAFLESSGLERSLSTNIPDHPTAIQVNGLRQERTEHVMCPGHVYGTNSFDTRTLVGNWAEERCDKAYIPSDSKCPTGSDWQWPTTYNEMTKNLAHKVIPAKASNAETMFTKVGPSQPFATGVKEESLSSNKEACKLGGVAGIDYQVGDHRSVVRFPGNYVSYQCGKQHLIAQMGGRVNSLPAYETTTAAAFYDPATKRLPICSVRCDLTGKPHFHFRDPGRDGKSKMLCGIKSNEFACDDSSPEYVTTHILGKPVKGKQRVYTIDEYRKTWTKNAPEIVAAGMVDSTEHRSCYVTPDLTMIDAVRKMPGHVGSWH